MVRVLRTLRFAKASAVEFFTPQLPDAAASLGLALVVSSHTPLLLLNTDMIVVAASSSFCSQFGLQPADVPKQSFFDLGQGEWDVPQLRPLLKSVASGAAPIDAYEFELIRAGLPTACLCIHAHRVELLPDADLYIVVALADETHLRHTEKARAKLLREKQELRRELQHRVANSLQIIASILMQSARRAQSEEASHHIQDAHHRVMSLATLQRMLAKDSDDEVSLATYLTDLCASISASMIANAQTLRIDVTVDESRVSADESISVGLIVTELVINALKHGFPNRNKRGTIAVDYKSDGQGWIISVRDDGVGMPDPALKVKPGLGTGIIEALAVQLEAVIEISDAKPGTLVTVTHATDDDDAAIPRLV